MTEWLPAIVGLILAGMGVEAAVLALYHRRTGRGPAPGDVVPNLISGACLLAAVLAVLVQSSWLVVPPFLLGALAGHVIDLRRRWPG